MANVLFRAVTPEVTLGDDVQTVLQIAAPANQRVLVHSIAMSFKPISTTETPIKVDIVRQTSAGTMSSLTPVKNNAGDNETIQTTAQYDATAEPTTTDTIESMEIHPQSRQVFYFRNPIVVIGGSRLGVRMTAGTSLAYTIVSMECEE